MADRSSCSTFYRNELQARNISLTSGSLLSTSTFGQGNAGDINITATDTVLFDGKINDFFSGAFSRVQTGGVGDAGEINIQTKNFYLTNNAQISVSTLGQGDAGDINVIATDIASLDGRSLASSSVQTGGLGDGGEVNIQTRSLSLTNDAQIYASTSGQGNAGSINVRAIDTIALDNSAILNTVRSGGVGNGGEINIYGRELSLTNGGQLLTGVRSAKDNLPAGQGNAGTVNLNIAETVTITGDNSLIGTEMRSEGSGNGGDISIQTSSFFMMDNATISSSTLGQGDAGKITIQAANIILDNVIISSSTLGQGNAGKITIQAANIVLDGAAIHSNVAPEAIGNSQGIEITTGTLLARNLTLLSSSTSGQGDAGKIEILATDTVSIDRSGVFSIVDNGFFLVNGEKPNSVGNGNSQEIYISTNQLFLTNSAGILADTNGIGNAGKVRIRASNAITLDNGFITASVGSNAVGSAQGIDISTGRLNLTNGAAISASTDGQGDAGQVQIQASDTVTLDNGIISASAFTNAGGNALGIDIATNQLSLTNNSLLDAVSSGNNDAGEITVDANRIQIDRSSITTSTSGGAGNIRLRSPELFLRNNSIIRTDARGEELTGGNITIDSDVIAALENSDINANALEGFGGDVTINAAGIFGTSVRRENSRDSDITATGKDQVDDGEIALNAEINPASGLLNLPETPVDAASLLGQDFCSRQRNSQFIVTGRGGIPATPADVASPTTVWQDLSLTEIAETPITGENPEAEVPERPVLIEAQGWYVNEAGQVILTANPTTAAPHQSGRIPAQCGSAQLMTDD